MANNLNALGIPKPPGDVSIVPIRAAAAVTAGEVIATAHRDDGTGWFNIQGCPLVNIWARWTEGNATSVTLEAHVTDTAQAVAYNMNLNAITAGSPVLAPEILEWSLVVITSANLVITVNNPGAAFMRIRALGVTGSDFIGSSLVLGITRSWGTALPYNS